ncbi:uncharacterized protein [Haliotis cracherodii]|uniref:uncharacterized protein n=1 Tax=Haliotis cracherodii TaxID=6455 RepID=UPI0039EA68BA
MDTLSQIRVNPIVRIRGSYVKYIVQELLFTAQCLVPDSLQCKAIERVFRRGLQLLEDRVRLSCSRANLHSLNEDQMRILEKDLLGSEDRLMEAFMSEGSCEDTPDYEPLTDADNDAKIETGPHNYHLALSHHHQELMACLNTRGTLLLDVMAQNDLLSDSDEEDIQKCEFHGERNQRVLEILSTTSPKKNIKCVTEFIKATNPDLGRRLSKSMRELACGYREQCAACTVVTQIDPSRIAKLMFHNKTIPVRFYQDLKNPAISSQKKWNIIKEKDLDIAAIEALQSKFQHFHDMFGDDKRLICRCDRISVEDHPAGVMTRSSGASTFRYWLSKPKDAQGRKIIQMKNDIFNISKSLEDIKSKVFLSQQDGQEQYRSRPHFWSSHDLHHDTAMYGNRGERVWRTNFNKTREWNPGDDKPKKRSGNIFKRLRKKLLRN